MKCRHVPYETNPCLCMYCHEQLYPFLDKIHVEPITSRPVDAAKLLRLALERLEMDA